MNTGLESSSKTRKRLSIVAACTGSAAIIILAIAFVTVDFNKFYVSSAFTIDDSAIEALEPVRSDQGSETDGQTGDNTDGSGNGTGDTSSVGNDGTGSYADHGLPCLDPNCPIHHPTKGSYGTTDGTSDGSSTDNAGNKTGDGGEDNAPPAEISLETVNFKANMAEYVDEDAANAVLSEYVSAFDRYFERYPDGKVYLVGCIAKTATWSYTETELSLERAETVRQSLINLGVDGDRLVAMGIGISDPWRSDEWADGYFDEDIAKTNRRVWLIPDQYSEQVDMVLAVEAEIDSLRAE